MNYYDWLTELLVPDEDVRDSYQKLLAGLFETMFEWSINNDENRACDGIQLRDIYENDTGLWCNMFGPCSILEMLGAMAIRWENEFMYDPDEENRTHVWFWEMLTNLGLNNMDDWHFDEENFYTILRNFNDRKYSKDGYGGPFYIEGCRKDLRKMELWYQLNYYIQSKYE